MADIKKIALTIAVGILLALFVGFLVDAVYDSPKYDEFCRPNADNFPKPVDKLRPNETCPNYIVPAALQNSCFGDNGYIQYKYDSNSCAYDSYCETCGVDFDKMNKAYSRNLFFILAPISILLIIIGMFLSLEAIGSGFIFGGILTLIYATIRVFGDLSKIMRVILLGIELALVIWLGYKRIEKGNKGAIKKHK